MSKKKTFVGGICSIAITTALLVGCSSSPVENVSQACDATKAYATSLENFQNSLNSDSSVGEIRSAYDEVQKAHKAYVDASVDVSQDRLKDLNSAQEAFDKAVKDLPDDATVAQSVDSLKDDAKAVESARSNLATDLSC